MGRVNKSTEGVFTEIAGTGERRSAYDVFLNNGTPVSSDLVHYLGIYAAEIDRHRDLFEQLAQLEEIIMQIRSRDKLSPVKLSIIRGYIYARAPFYRRGKVVKDIRVIAGRTDFWGNDVNILSTNAEFMEVARRMLVKGMTREISMKTGVRDLLRSAA